MIFWKIGMSWPSCQPVRASRYATRSRHWSKAVLTIVVSPLVALMQDQVAALKFAGCCRRNHQLRSIPRSEC